MKNLLICMSFILLMASFAWAQKTVTGTVMEYNPDWKTIDVKVGKLSYQVFTVAARGCRTKACNESANFPAPKIVGRVTSVGTRVRISYIRIIPEHGFGPILRGVTKIVEIK